MTAEAALVALVLTATTATTAVPRDLFLDYSACTKGRQVCAAERTELRDALDDCRADLEQSDAEDLAAVPCPACEAPAGWSTLEVVGVGAIVAVVAGAVGLVVGAGVSK
ncbi:MAG: hypothetical protein IPG45_05890 [Deltaproteobacteria bacterium]|nr:hypothetical protein [Deltaproteobacteria bacterium]